MLAHSKQYTIPHREFDDALTAIAGKDRSARIKLIDRYDTIRKQEGGAVAVQWIKDEAEKHKRSILDHVLSVVQDDTARRIIQAALDSGNIKKQAWLEARLTHEMIADAAQYAGITEDGIWEQTHSPLERRRLRFKVKQSINRINLAVGATGGKNGFALATPFEMAMRKTQKANQAEWAAETYIYCEEIHKIVSMLDIMAAAGKKRVGEILAIAVGLQDFGEKHGLVPIFYTLTAPPRMHPNPTIGRNSWDGTSPREAQAWIHARHRAAFQILRDEGIIPAGIRTVEGHQDECPHWHCIAWVKPEDVERFKKVLRSVAPSWKSKKGCDIKNMLDEPEGKNKAKAISYLFKYILKSIGGLDEDDDIDCELADAIERQDCWRAKHAIRGFQFFGLPQLGLWRNLRKTPDEIGDELLDKARSAAKSGRGCDFIEAAGGLNLKRKERPISARIEVRKGIENEEENGKFVVFENRMNGFNSEQRLATWEIIDEKEKNNLLTLIENHPRKPNTPQPTPETDLETELREVLGLDFRSQYPPPARQPQNFPVFY